MVEGIKLPATPGEMQLAALRETYHTGQVKLDANEWFWRPYLVFEQRADTNCGSWLFQSLAALGFRNVVWNFARLMGVQPTTVSRWAGSDTVPHHAVAYVQLALALKAVLRRAQLAESRYMQERARCLELESKLEAATNDSEHKARQLAELRDKLHRPRTARADYTVVGFGEGTEDDPASAPLSRVFPGL